MPSLKLHFLNVGHGDCTFVELPSGRLMMIDINNSKSLPSDDIEALAEAKSMSVSEFRHSSMLTKSMSSEDYYRSLLVDPIDYYRQHFDGRTIFRYVQTHPDMDHMSGLYRFFWQEGVPLENFWDTAHDKDLSNDDWENSKYAQQDWLIYQTLSAGIGPNGTTHNTLQNYRGDSHSYWTDDNIQIFSPTKALIESSNARGSYNNVSYVLKITYGGRSVILPGDAEAAAWTSMLENPGEAALNCDLLKAAHHGRESGFHQDAYDAMNPSVVICSVGKKPSTDASDEYAASGARVLSTRFNGSIVATMWSDGDIWIDAADGNRLAEITG